MQKNHLTLPVVVGLAVGVVLIASVWYFYSYILSEGTPPGSGQLLEFNTPNKLTEVKLLFSKYPSNATTYGFSRGDKTITFDYIVQESVDTNGDGFKETVRRLDLFVTYDETYGNIQDYPYAKLVSMNATCTEPSPSNAYKWVNVEQPATDGQVLDYLRNTGCVY